MSTANAGGTGDAISIARLPCVPTTTLLILNFTYPNATGAPTLTPVGGPTQVILDAFGHALIPGIFQPGSKGLLSNNGVNWFLLSPSVGSFAPTGSTVPNLSSLKGLTGNVAGNMVVRAGFNAAGDGGRVSYVYSATPCTLNSGAGDNGLQVAPTAGGGCWIADMSNGPADVRVWGGCLVPTADSSAAIQAAVTANPSGTIHFPIGTCQFNSPITISYSHITIQGEGTPGGTSFGGSQTGGTMLNCRTVTTSCFVTSPPGGNDTTNRLMAINFKDLTIDGTGQTAGEAIDMIGVSNGLIENVWIANSWSGILFYNINTVIYKRGQLLSPRGGYAIKYDDDLTVRGDVLILEDVIANCNFLGAEGIVWDGPSYSLGLRHGAMLNCLHDLHIVNSRASSSLFPQHLQAYGWAADGATINAVRIDGGSEFHFTDAILDNATGRTGQGNSDGAVFYVAPDTGHSNTNTIFIIGGLFSSGASQCAFIDATIVLISATEMGNCGIGHVGTFADLEFGPHSSHQVLSGNSFFPAGSHTYSVMVDGGASLSPNYALNGNDYDAPGTGAINDGGGAGVGTVIHQAGAVCGASSATSVSVAYNLGFPTQIMSVNVSPAGSWPGSFAVTSSTKTGFTISYAGGPGLTFCFQWQADGT